MFVSQISRSTSILELVNRPKQYYLIYTIIVYTRYQNFDQYLIY